MDLPYVPPSADKTAFNCPICRAYAKQRWFELSRVGIPRGKTLQEYLESPVQSMARTSTPVQDKFASECDQCHKVTIWQGTSILWPRQHSAPPANADLPEDVRKDYEEAAAIMVDSQRGAAALLRLAVQKLCEHLGAKGDGLDDYIKKWVAKGLDRRIEQALDSVRVVGNHSVHPGKIDVEDDPATVETLFFLVNYIADRQVSEPKRVDEFFDRTVPPDEKERIERRNRPSI